MRKRRLIKRERNKAKKMVIVSALSLLVVITVGYAAFQTNLNITAKGNIKEKSRVIQSWQREDVTDFHSAFYKESIVSVAFLDNANVPSNATESWNVSEDKTHGGVMAWVIPNNEDNTKYNLYIGAQDGVIANVDSKVLFFRFLNLKTIDFNDNFDTSNVKNMSAMFQHTSIEYLDLSNFNTSNVTSMQNMFSECTNLIVDISKFNTQNVTNMQGMFVQTAALQSIFVGPNWTAANANITNMFGGSNVSSVTTGQC